MLNAAKHLAAHGERPSLRLGVKREPVMLSAAKHLDAHRARPFAALRVTSKDHRIQPGAITTFFSPKI